MCSRIYALLWVWHYIQHHIMLNSDRLDVMQYNSEISVGTKSHTFTSDFHNVLLKSYYLYNLKWLHVQIKWTSLKRFRELVLEGPHVVGQGGGGNDHGVPCHLSHGDPLLSRQTWLKTLPSRNLRKDGRRRQLHRFHLSWPCPKSLDPLFV